MQAVITSGGKQYIVEKDQTLELELLGDTKKFELEALEAALPAYCPKKFE